MLVELVARGVLPDRIYGTSAGAINGAALASDPTPEGIENLCNIWRGLTREKIFPGSRAQTMVRAVQRRGWLFPSSGLRAVIEAGLAFENLEESPIPLEVVATSLVSGTERRLTSGPAVEALLASAALPGLFPPVVINGEALVDGSVVNNVPIAQAIADGANEVYVLLAGDIQPKPAESFRPLGGLFSALNIAIHNRFFVELDDYRTRHPDVVINVISAGGEARSAYNDFSVTEQLISDGRRAAAALLDGKGVHPRVR